MNFRHNPESLYALAAYDAESQQFLEPASLDDPRADSDALAFFSLQAAEGEE